MLRESKGKASHLPATTEVLEFNFWGRNMPCLFHRHVNLRFTAPPPNIGATFRRLPRLCDPCTGCKVILEHNIVSSPSVLSVSWVQVQGPLAL